MIDLENEIFDTLSDALTTKYSSISVYGEYVKSPASFPAVMIEEKGNSVFIPTQDSSSLENHVSLMYEVNVYSNKKFGKKTESKAIFATLDSEFQKLGFTRTMREPIPNLNDATIYRMVGRYTAVASTDTIYRR